MRRAQAGRALTFGMRGWTLALILPALAMPLCAQSGGDQQQTPQSNPASQPAPAQDPAQATPPAAPEIPAVQDQPAADQFQPYQPVSGQNPQPEERQVNTTGGLVTTHPADIFTTPALYSSRQAASIATEEPDETALPVVDEMILSVPDLTYLNENASSLTYQDRHSGPFNLGMETTWTYTSNIFNNFVGGKIAGGDIFDIAVPVAYDYNSDRTTFNSFFRGDYARYPGNSELNHNSEIYTQSLTHKSSEVTTWSWSAGGGRVVAVEDYLTPVLAIGTTGVAQPSFAGGLEPIYNAASTLSVTHRLSERDTVIGSATGGWLQEPFSEGNLSGPIVWNRELTGGADVQYQHALNPTQAYGVELSDIYVEGLSPSGDANFTEVKGTFQQALFAHGSVHAGLGPLFDHTASNLYHPQSGVSYTADASFDYQASYSRMSFGYQRIFELGYLSPASIANELFARFDRPIASTLDVTATLEYIRASNSGLPNLAGEYSDLGISARLNKYLTPHLALFAQGDVFQQGAGPSTLGANSITGGVSWSLGNPFFRSGAQ